MRKGWPWVLAALLVALLVVQLRGRETVPPGDPVTAAEDAILRYLETRSPADRETARQRIDAAWGGWLDDPRHAWLGVSRDFLAEEAGEPRPPGPWRRASVDYLFRTRNPVEALAEIREERLHGRYRDEALHQIATGLFSDVREDQLMELVSRVVPEDRLWGSTVADIGCGTGQFSVALVDAVGPRGKVLSQDIAPTVREVLDLARRDDPRFGRVEFVLGSGTSVELPKGSVDVAFLMDVHCAGGKPGDADYRTRVLPWLRSIRESLRPDGLVVMYESHPDPPQELAAQMLEDAGFREQKPVPVTQDFGGQAGRGYLLLARP